MKLVVTMFVSLDGVVQSPGGPDEDRDGGFALGGWVVPHFDEDFGRTIDGWFAGAGAFLLGRRTYEIFASHWPHVTDPDDPVAAALNRLPKYLASRTFSRADWRGTTIVTDVVPEVRRLKALPGRELQVHGSGGLVQTLVRHDLVDEYRLLQFPVVLGTGKRLFEAGATPAALALLDSRRTSRGVLVQTYRRAGDIELGAVGLETQSVR